MSISGTARVEAKCSDNILDSHLKKAYMKTLALPSTELMALPFTYSLAVSTTLLMLDRIPILWVGQLEIGINRNLFSVHCFSRTPCQILSISRGSIFFPCPSIVPLRNLSFHRPEFRWQRYAPS